MPRPVSLVIIGDEILDGRIRDTNTAELAQRCRRLGTRLVQSITVADTRDAVRDGVGRAAEALPEPGLIITSGGLGPTLDDATRAGLADFDGSPLIEDADAVARVRDRYASRHRALEPSGRRQALRPDNASFLINPVGTADGLRMQVGEHMLLALPGVPHEFRTFLDRHVSAELCSESARSFHRGWLFGIGESEVASQLESMQELADLHITYCARFPVIELEVSHPDAMRSQAGWDTIGDKLAPWLLPDGASSPEAALATLADRRDDLRIALAESCTGGFLASRLTDPPGASRWFPGGWITYSNDLKSSALDVPAPLLARHGAVSAEVARAMAQGALRAAKASLAIAVTGIAGPSGGSEEKPLGTVYICVADARGSLVLHACFAGVARRGFKRLASAAAARLAERKVHGREAVLASMYGFRELIPLPA